MNDPVVQLPALLSLPFRLVPNVVHSTCLTLAINRVFAQQITEGELDFLRDRVVTIRISDTGVDYRMILQGNGFVAAPASKETDVAIIGALYDFMVLASREEDPDTLFFNRRLRIEGETALGLELKNYLDSQEMEIPATFPKVVRDAPHNAVTLYRRLFGRNPDKSATA